MLAGGYTKFRPITEEDKVIFDKAMKGLVGVDYEPLIVSTQVVKGTNYRFVCNAELIGVKPTYYLAGVVIYVPLPSEADPNPVIVEIERFDK